MELFKLENEMPIFSSEVRAIKEFSTYIKRCRPPGGGYDQANKEAIKRLAFLYFMVHWGSTYVERYPDINDRAKKLIHDLNINDAFDPGAEYVRDALQKYDELNATVTSGVLISAKRAILKLEKYFDDVDFTEKDSKGNLLYTPKTVIDAIKGLKGMVGGLDELENDVRKEQVQGKGIIKGGGIEGAFEDDDEKEFQSNMQVLKKNAS